MASSQRNNEAECTSSKTAAAVGWADTICDVAPIQLHVIGVADAEVYLTCPVAGLFAMNMEDVVRYPTSGRVSLSRIHKSQSHNSVAKLPRIEELEAVAVSRHICLAPKM